MKKTNLIVIACCALALMGCGNKSKSSNNNAQETHQHDHDHDHDHDHAAEASLFGTYKGTLPAADCPGINQTLTLNQDNTFTLNSEYIDRKGSNTNESGSFQVAGEIVTLTPQNGKASHYKIGEGTVTLLTPEKQAITGDLADQYILKKECAH